MAEEPINANIVMNDFALNGQGTMESNLCIKQAINRKAFGFMIDA